MNDSSPPPNRSGDDQTGGPSGTKILGGWNPGTILFVAIAGWFLYEVRGVLVVVFGSMLFAALLEPAVKRVARVEINSRPLGRKAGAAIVMVLAAIATAVSIVSVAPNIWHQAVAFFTSLPEYIDVTRAKILGWEAANDFLPAEAERVLEQEVGRIMADGGKFAATWAVSQALNILQLVGLLVIPIGAFYFLTDGTSLRRQLLDGIPPTLRPRVEMVVDVGTKSLSRYVRGQTMVCIVAGIMHTIMFTIVGLPFSLVIGLLAGLAEAIPFLGAMVVGVTVGVVGIAESPTVALLALGYYFIFGNTFVNYVISPRLMSQNLDVHPFVIIMAALVGSSMGGALGAVIALPTAVVLQSLARTVWGAQIDDTIESESKPTA